MWNPKGWANISVDFVIRTFPEEIAMEYLFQHNENINLQEQLIMCKQKQ